MELSDLPPYKEFLLPVLQAVQALGGTAHAKEITEWMVERLGFNDDVVAVEYPNRPGESVLLDRMAWARSYDKLGGLVDTPQRGLYVLSAEGKRILALPEAEARRFVDEMDREIRRARSRRKPIEPEPVDLDQDLDPEPLGGESDAEADSLDLKAALLARLHALTPRGFENFVVHLLKSYGMELTRTGGSNDEGVDAIGLAQSATFSPIEWRCRSSDTTQKAPGRTSNAGTSPVSARRRLEGSRASRICHARHVLAGGT